MANRDITKELLLTLFDYKDGELIWRISRGNRAKIGNSAGYIREDGRCSIRINKKLYLRYRLIFLIHNGFLPKVIDHIDGNPSNDKIENLRATTQPNNVCNSKKPKTNKSGIKGVSWFRKKWRAALQVNKKSIHLGCFDDIKSAENAVKLAREQYHGEFARHN